MSLLRQDHGLNRSKQNSGNCRQFLITRTLRSIGRLKCLRCHPGEANIRTFTTVSAFKFISVFRPMLILTSHLRQTGFLTESQSVRSDVVKTILITFTTASANVVISLHLPILLRTSHIFQAIRVAATHRTTATGIHGLVIRLCTKQANFVRRTRRILFLIFQARRHLFNMFERENRLISLILRVRSRRQRYLMLPRDPFLIRATATSSFQLAKARLSERAICLFRRAIFLPGFRWLHRRSITSGRCIINGYRNRCVVYTLNCGSARRAPLPPGGKPTGLWGSFTRKLDPTGS